MFSRKHRATRAEISEIGRRFATVHQPHVAFSYAVITGIPGPKITVSVSKKVARQASDRALLKRRGRAAAQEHLGLLPRPLIGLVRIKQPADQETYRSELESLFRTVASRVT